MTFDFYIALSHMVLKVHNSKRLNVGGEFLHVIKPFLQDQVGTDPDLFTVSHKHDSED